MSEQTNLQIMYLNARRIRNKLEMREILIAENKEPDLMIIMETWLDPEDEKYIHFKGYNTFLQVGNKRKELLLRLRNNTRVVKYINIAKVLVVYRPPSSDQEIFWTKI